MSSKFVVTNEFQPNNSDNVSTEIIGVFSSYENAYEALADLAVANEVYLSANSDSFQVDDPASHLEFDEYLILEFIEDEVAE